MLFLFWACSEQPMTKNETTPPWMDYDMTISGPFSVGHIQYTHEYTPIENQPSRNIVIDIWYPTSDTSGDEGQYLYGVDPLVFEEASVAPSAYEDGYPIHVHSHGYRGWGATSSTLMRHFASHGWISVAPNHTNNLLGDHESPLPVAHYIHRSLDIQESINILEDMDLFSTVQSNSVLMSGHSFGSGYSAWSVAGASFTETDIFCDTGVGLEDESIRCTDGEKEIFLSGALREPRIKAIIPMAGTIRQSFFGTTGHQSVTIPILFLSGTEDGHESAQNHWQAMNELNFRWLSLEGGCHQTFALGQCATLDVDLGFSIVSSYSLAFARNTILQDDTSTTLDWINGNTQPYSQAVIQVSP